MYRAIIPDFSEQFLDASRVHYINKSIGKGGFGQVFCGRVKLNGSEEYTPCAYKIQPTWRLTPDQLWVKDHNPQREASMHRKVSGHTGIVELLGEVEAKDCHFTVLELCNGGSLHNVINNRGDMAPSVEETRSIFGQIINALEYCHTKGVYHCDLKSENILITSTGEIKLADFGLATDSLLTGRRGSPFFMAPEAHGASTNKPYSGYSADIWALGVILMEFVTGEALWRYPDAVRDVKYAEYARAVDQVEYLYRTLGVSLPIAHLLSEIFNSDPNARPSLEEIRGTIMSVSSFIDPEAKKTPYVATIPIPINLNSASKPSPSATLVPPSLKTSSSKTKFSSLLKRLHVAPSRSASPSAILNPSQSALPFAPSVAPPLPDIKNMPSSPRKENKLLKIVRKVAKPLRQGFPKISW